MLRSESDQIRLHTGGVISGIVRACHGGNTAIWIVRVLFALFLSWHIGLLLYGFLWLVMPIKPAAFSYKY